MSSKSTRSTKEGEEYQKQTLPVGHPQAGYYGPDLSFIDSNGTLSPEEQDWHVARNDQHNAEVSAVEEHEDRVARLEDAAESQPEKTKDAPKASSS